MHEQLRVGQGFDAHRFEDEAGGELWVAGIRWLDDEAQGAHGIDGDSDGDVAAHALIDALLSAAGLGDIGSFFGVGPTSRGAGKHGVAMLREVITALQQHQWHVVNASVTIIGNRPHISRHRAECEQVLTEVIQAPVTVLATTTDGMGFTGRSEGIAAQAVVLLQA